MKKIFENKLASIGFMIVAVLAVIAVSAPAIVPYDANQIDIGNILSAPSRGHILGTDQLGRDVFSRVLYGSRISLSIGFVAVGIATLIGIMLGSIAGFYGGRVDSAISRFIDIMLCFPTIFLILAVIAVIGPSIYNIMFIIGLTNWMGVARLIRAEILSLRRREFIEAARAIGASDLRIIIRHLIPNAISPVIVSATLGVAGAILVESSLSFLGLGVQPPTPSWGNMLADGKAVLGAGWWLMLFPGLSILITVLGYNLLGEGIRDLTRSKSR